MTDLSPVDRAPATRSHEPEREIDMAPKTFDPDTCERIFHAALAAGDFKGVEAALTVMAPQDPHRAELLFNTLKVGLAMAEERRPATTESR